MAKADRLSLDDEDPRLLRAGESGEHLLRRRAHRAPQHADRGIRHCRGG